jgi:formate dehydrogenase major subunit
MQPYLNTCICGFDSPRAFLGRLLNKAGSVVLGSVSATTVRPVVSFRVDGKEFQSVSGENLLEALIKVGVDVPHLCYRPDLGALKTCDACVVEVNGVLARSCDTRVAKDHSIVVSSPRVLRAQHRAVDQILRNHSLYCTICDNNNGDCELHNLAMKISVKKQDFEPKPYSVDSSNPFYVYSPNQCILCGRCVEACQDLVVNEVITIDWELRVPRVIWDRGSPIDQSSCVSCGTCVTVCPVDALMEKSMLGKTGHFTNVDEQTKMKLVNLVKSAGTSFDGLWLLSEIEAKARLASIKKTKTVCTFCGVGCSFEVWTKGREILKVEPKPESPANGVATCVKGKFGWEYVNSPDRLVKPLVRRSNSFVQSSWDEAVLYVANRLKETVEKYGADSVGVIATCTGTNEEAYLAQKLARQVLGTNNVDNCARYCQAPATTGLFRTVGYGADAGSIAQIAEADLVMIIGSNTAEAHPVLAGRIKAAKKLRGQKLIVVDTRRHEMADRADVYVCPKAGTDLVLLNAVAKYIVDRDWHDKEFVERRTTGFEEFRNSLGSYTLEHAEKVTGVPKEKLVKIAEMIHEVKKVCILWAMGITQHQNGSETSTAICNLLLLTGNFGRPGTGGYPLRGHCNVQGASDFGALPAFLPGYQRVGDSGVREKFEKAWRVRLPASTGLTSTEMVDAVLDGRVHALYIIGEDKVLADSNQSRVAEALSKLDFLVVQDVFLSRTAEFADVVLPAAVSLEKEGTFVNTERRIQRIFKVFEPLGDSRADWEILQMVAKALGADWNYCGPSEIMREMAELTPLFTGVSYERLEGFKSLLWPVAADGSDTEYLYENRFAFPDGKARFYPTEFTEPLEADGEYDLYLNNGRMLEHFHWGNMTSKSTGLAQKVPSVFVEVSPALAEERGLKDGDTVRVVSATGSLKAKVLVTQRVSSKTLFLAIHDSGEKAVNLLTSDVRDAATNTPAYKELPVRLEKIAGHPASAPPLPRNNPRFGRRNPQLGVQIEKKWSRKDYSPLGE